MGRINKDATKIQPEVVVENKPETKVKVRRVPKGTLEKKENDTQINFKMNSSMQNAFYNICFRNGKTMSEVARDLIYDYVNKNAKDGDFECETMPLKN